MSEFQPKFESGKESQLDSKDIEKLADKNYERLKKDAEAAEARQNSIESIQERIEKTALSKEKLAADRHEKTAEKPLYTNKKHRDYAVKQTIKRTQKQLPLPQRAFSKVVHQPVVEVLSNIAAPTVARPSGLLFGGLFSVISNLLVLYICRHYGYEYNFFIGLAAFAGGFAIGILLEGAYKLARVRRR